MAERGAKNILVLSRSGAKHSQTQVFIQEMEAKGIRVVARKCDVAAKEEVAACVKEAASEDGLPPVRGVIHAAMAIKVCNESQTSESGSYANAHRAGLVVGGYELRPVV